MNLKNNIFYRKALEFIATTDLDSLEPGTHTIDGENLYVNIVDSQLKTPEQARLEVHNKYIDIQVPLSGPESFGVKPRSSAKNPEGEMNVEKDILFFSDKEWQTITVGQGQPVTFDQDTAHAPLISPDGKPGVIHKAIFKVRAI